MNSTKIDVRSLPRDDAPRRSRKQTRTTSVPFRRSCSVDPPGSINRGATEYSVSANTLRFCGNMPQTIAIDYTNWRGERRWRIVEPTGQMKFESTEYHPTPQWIMYAKDLVKGEVRGFAMCDIHRWIAPRRPKEADAEVEAFNEPAREMCRRMITDSGVVAA